MANTTRTDACLDPATRARVLGELAGTRIDHGPYAPVTALFEAQTDRTPDRPALCYRSTTVTYRELDELANGLATELAAAGVQRGDVVPVVLANSLELPLCMLALMKLGAAFAPCDPAWPAERLATVRGLLRPRVTLVAESSDQEGLAVAADRITPTRRRPGPPPAPDALAYGIFTSGTTGAPKCALNVHRGLANRFRFMSRYLRADGSEVVLLNSKHTFDSAIWQLLWPLTTGGRTVVPERGEFLDLERTVATIDEHRVTVTDFVPATLASLVALLDNDPAQVARVSSLRHLVVGGEEIGPHAVHRLRRLVPGLAISNGYGPSETSIGMVFHPVDETDGEHIPLGRPIDNCYAVVLGDDLELLPPGEVGEIVVGGDCLGSGYFGAPDHTARVFVANPYPEIPGYRLYRTGDLGWFDERGRLRFAGRRDQQVKVDGIRIELGELEAVAEGASGVWQAKALAVHTGGRTRIAVVAAGTTTASALRAYLVSRLPRTSMPQQCLVVPALPLTDNGKADLGELRALVLRELGSREPGRRSSPGAATGPLPLRIAEVLREVLDLAEYGEEDRFLDHGGDSLTALSAVFRLRELFGTRIGVQDLYVHQTPAALAALLSGPAGAPAEDGSGNPGAEAGDGDIAELMEHDATLADRVSVPPPVCTPRVRAVPPARSGGAGKAEAIKGAEQAEEAAAAAPLRRSGPPETVLVTGATGFIGSRVVHRLLTATDARVVCLARGRDDREAAHRVAQTLRRLRLPGLPDGIGPAEPGGPRSTVRLEVRAGDLGAPRFGLAATDWDALAAACDAVVHIGALVNFLFDYRAHRPANVLGTAEALRFSLTGKVKPLHHVSTLGVLDRHAARTGERLPEDVDPARVLAPLSGYSRSKWVAERLLLRAAARGAPVSVYRLGEVMPAADNGVANPKALTHLLLTAFHRLGVCPDVPMRSDYTPVDDVAARLVACAERHERRVLHLFHGESVDFCSVLARGGVALRRVSEAEFLRRLRARARAHHGEADTLLGLLTRSGGASALSGLLTDNAALFSKDGCAALDRRHGFADRPLDAAIAAYARSLGRC